MTRDTRLAAHIDRCEDDLARLIRACIDNGGLTPGETGELRRLAGELKALGHDIEERMAALGVVPGWIHGQGPASTLH
jgi:hypothetical protein